MAQEGHGVPGETPLPSVSQAQQRFFAIAEHNPDALRGKKPRMSPQQLHDFAATPTSDLPLHAPDKPPVRRNSYRRRVK